MNKFNLCVVTTLIGAGLSANVVAADLVTFSADTQAKAEEVNANFTELQSRISTLSATDTDLENRLAAVEAMLGGAQPSYASLIGGNTYSGQFIYFGYLGNDYDNGFGDTAGGINGIQPHSMQFNKGGGTVSLTLNSDGTVTAESGTEEESEGKLIPSCTNWDEYPDCSAYSNNTTTNSDSWSGDLGTTWSVNESTGVVTIAWEGDPEDTTDFNTSSSGDVLYSLTYYNITDGMREITNSIVILSKVN